MKTGDFRGSSANLSGEGFAGMHFITRASSEEDYHQWVESAKKSSKLSDFKEYNQLAAPSKNNPVEIYQLKDEQPLRSDHHEIYAPPREMNTDYVW